MRERSQRMRGSIVGHDSYWLRRLAYVGARYGSTQFVRTGPVAIGALFSGILPKYRRAIRANLRRIYGPRGVWQENRDVTKTFVDYACCLTESLGFERMHPEDVTYGLVDARHSIPCCRSLQDSSSQRLMSAPGTRLQFICIR